MSRGSRWACHEQQSYMRACAVKGLALLALGQRISLQRPLQSMELRQDSTSAVRALPGSRLRLSVCGARF